MAPGARAPHFVGYSLRVLISGKLVSQEESSVRGAADDPGGATARNRKCVAPRGYGGPCFRLAHAP